MEILALAGRAEAQGRHRYLDHIDLGLLVVEISSSSQIGVGSHALEAGTASQSLVQALAGDLNDLVLLGFNSKSMQML